MSQSATLKEWSVQGCKRAKHKTYSPLNEWPLRFGWLLVRSLDKKDYLQIFKWGPFDYTAFAVSEKVGYAETAWFNHTSWIAVTPTDCPKLVRKRCVIEVLVAFWCCQLVGKFSVGKGAFAVFLIKNTEIPKQRKSSATFIKEWNALYEYRIRKTKDK